MVSKRKVGSIKQNGGQRGVSRSGWGDDTPRLNPASDPRPEGRGPYTEQTVASPESEMVKEHPVKKN